MKPEDPGFRIYVHFSSYTSTIELCLATSLVERRGFDATDQMDRYCRWAEAGYFSSTGRCFDIGNTVAAALRRYKTTGESFSGSTDSRSAGNGSIMRLAPVPMYFFPSYDDAIHYAAESSRTTHGAQECVDACRLLAAILFRALEGRGKEDVLFADHDFDGSERIVAIARGTYRNKSIEEIRGTGYVVECLEAGLWCFLHTETFEKAILTAANLGDDADTTAAVCGQVAGAYYGVVGIPRHWLGTLSMRAEITTLADRLYETEPA